MSHLHDQLQGKLTFRFGMLKGQLGHQIFHKPESDYVQSARHKRQIISNFATREENHASNSPLVQTNLKTMNKISLYFTRRISRATMWEKFEDVLKFTLCEVHLEKYLVRQKISQSQSQSQLYIWQNHRLYSWNDTTYINFDNKKANTKTILLAMPYIKPMGKGYIFKCYLIRQCTLWN